MSFLSSYGSRVNAAVAARLGELITYRPAAGGETSINAILIRAPETLADEFQFEFRPTLDIPAHLHHEPVQGDGVTGEDGSLWIVDSWDEFEGMWRCILRADLTSGVVEAAFSTAFSTAYNSQAL